MIVKELIKCLQQQNQEAEVSIVITLDDDETESFYEVVCVEQFTFPDMVSVSIRG
jgi:hypothetical protein